MNDSTTRRISVAPDKDDDHTEPHPTSASEKTVQITRKPTDEVMVPAGEMQSVYKLVTRIGDGGMGVVFLARDRKLGRYVAIKRLNKTSLLHEKLKERFLQEAKAIAALNHIHIVHIYALGEDDKGPYIAMEYIPGPIEDDAVTLPARPFALSDRVKKNGPMPLNDAVDLMIKIARAMEYAHSAGIIHRDLKPSNILLDKSWEPKIVDFGLARIFSEDEHKLTLTGDRMLSLGYGAPEQESDASLADERADVYGLGALTYFALTGKNPRYFRENDIPEAIRTTVSKALQTEVTKRWQSASEFLAALTELRTTTTVDISTTRTTWRCKWCDTSNPTSVKYCQDCGWDGSEMCPECTHETRIGVQYCPKCGIDARDYDMASHLHNYLERQWHDGEYDKIVQNADKISAFKPAGKNGKKLVDKIHDLKERALSVIKNREKLSRSITAAMAERHYEEARNLIHEHNALTGTTKFSKEMKKIPDLIRKRDMRRALEAQAGGQWKDVVRYSENILKHVSSDDQSAVNMLRSAKRNIRRAKLYGVLVGIICASVLYTASFAPAMKYREAPQKVPMFYAPASSLHKSGPLSRLLNSYASLWGVSEALLTDPGSVRPVADIPADLTKIQKFAEVRSRYLLSIEEITSKHSSEVATIPEDYVEELSNLLLKMQEAGDYDGWVEVNAEIERMDIPDSMPTEINVSTSKELLALRAKFVARKDSLDYNRYKEISKRSDEYVKNLTELQKKLTKAGAMEKAASVNTEINRIREDPLVTEAKMELTARQMERAAAEASRGK